MSRLIDWTDDDSEDEDDTELPESANQVRMTRPERSADRRNTQHLIKRGATDKKTISKYLSSDINVLLGDAIAGPDDNFVPLDWLLEAIETVAHLDPSTPTAPPMAFSTTPQDLQHNADLLERHDFDLTNIIREAQGTTMDPAAEFRRTTQLNPHIFNRHPNYAFVEDITQHGMEYHFLQELTEGQRQAELAANLQRGNHKSVSSCLNHLTRLLGRSVTYGLAMSIPKSTVTQVKQAMVQPAGLANPFSLHEDGSRVRKQRLTHDLTYARDPSRNVDRPRLGALHSAINNPAAGRQVHCFVGRRCQDYPDRHCPLPRPRLLCREAQPRRFRHPSPPTFPRPNPQ
jgi:hypothetical protein